MPPTAPGYTEAFAIYQGSVFDRTVYYKPGGNLANLTGYAARMQVRAPITADLLVDLTTENGGITLGGVAGSIRLYVSAVATASYTWRSGLFDLELIPPSGEPDAFKILYGPLPCIPEQTYA